MSLLEGLAGRLKSQLGHLENITGVQEGYECLSPGLFACALKEKGAALVAIATTASDEESRNVGITFSAVICHPPTDISY